MQIYMLILFILLYSYFTLCFCIATVTMTALCITGYACLTGGLTVVSGPCDQTYYCPGGQSTYTPAEYLCPEGFYCPQASAQPTICARGEPSFLYS